MGTSVDPADAAALAHYYHQHTAPTKYRTYPIVDRQRAPHRNIDENIHLVSL